MIEPAAQVAAQSSGLNKSAQQPIEKVADIEPSRAPNEGDVAKFQAEVSTQNNGVEKVNPVTQSQAVSPVQEVQQGDRRIHGVGQSENRLGDKMLDGVERLRAESKQHLNDIMVSLNDPNIGSSDMLKVVVDMNMWSLKQDLLAKSAGGVDRSVDNLLKAQ